MADEDIIGVMLGEPGEDTWNTLVLDRTDLIVPLERDFDNDPLQDDEVWLTAADGTVLHRLYSSDEDVSEDPEKRLRFYHFRDLRYGVYHVRVNVAGQAREVLRDIVIRAEGVFIGEKALPTTHDRPPLALDPTPSKIPTDDLDLEELAGGEEDDDWFPDQEEDDE